MGVARHRELLVLGAVRSHEIHGYALVEALARGLGMALDMKRPNVYALLERLEKKGLVAHRTERRSSHPERRVYRVTPQGRTSIAPLVRASAEDRVGAVIPLAAILPHIDELPLEERRTALEGCRDELLRGLAGLASIPQHGGSAGLALELVRRHYELDLELLQELLGDLTGA